MPSNTSLQVATWKWDWIIFNVRRALDAKDRGDKKAAKAQLKKVVEAEPDFSLAQLDLNALVQ